jgi:hypothetical protein
MRDAAKGWLDFSAKLVAVAALQSSEQWCPFKIFAFLAYAALFAFASSYIRWFVPFKLTRIKNENLRVAMLLLIFLVGAGFGQQKEKEII